MKKRFSRPTTRNRGRPPAKENLFIGLISGTSADGIEAALISVPHTRLGKPKVELVTHRSFLYPKTLRERVLKASEIILPGGRPSSPQFAAQSTADLTALHFELGERFAEAAIGVAKRAGVKLSKVKAIGSHGQTVCHRPPMGRRTIEATLQIGEAAVIAERTGVTTVADFRPADMAAGGLGAPFTPMPHGVLFSQPKSAVLAVNLGGIANVTWIPPGFRADALNHLNALKGFDTGPANMLLDAAMSRFSRGRVAYDPGGKWASKGRLDEQLLCHLIAHPFIRKKPPKATGREEFGIHSLQEAVQSFLKLRGRKVMRYGSQMFCDFMATLAAYTTRSIGKQVKRFLPPVGEVVVCGGGGRNRVLMEGLQKEFPSGKVIPADMRGIPLGSVEAVSFALLARAALLGLPANVPGITGAKRPVVLGKIIPAGLVLS